MLPMNRLVGASGLEWVIYNKRGSIKKKDVKFGFQETCPSWAQRMAVHPEESRVSADFKN